MSIFDVRGNGVGDVDKICFSDNDVCYIYKKYNNDVVIGDEHDDYCISVERDDIPNLIKALQKAVELGWGPKPVVVKKPKTIVKKVVAKKPVDMKLPIKAK